MPWKLHYGSTGMVVATCKTVGSLKQQWVPKCRLLNGTRACELCPGVSPCGLSWQLIVSRDCLAEGRNSMLKAVWSESWGFQERQGGRTGYPSGPLEDGVQAC